MGTTTFSTRIARAAALVGYPRSQAVDANTEAELALALERALKKIYRKRAWPWLRGEDRLELEAAVSAGSVAVTGAATAWTGTGTSWETGMGGQKRIRAAGEVFRVSTISGATSLATVGDAALATLSDEKYLLYADRYELSTLRAIESAKLALPGHEGPRYTPPGALLELQQQDNRLGHPEKWSILSYNSSGLAVVGVHPIPNHNEILWLTGMKPGTIPVADEQTDDVPDEFSDVVDDWMKVFAYEAFQDERQDGAERKAERTLKEMLGEAEPHQGPSEFVLDPYYFGDSR